MNSSEKQPLIPPILRWFMFAMVLANIAGSMTLMFVPLYLTELGASVEQVGMVFTLSSIVILFLLVFGGWLSDSIGRLRAIAIGSIGGILGWTFMILAPSWQWMLVALSVNQIPYALVGPSFGAFIAENSKEENRGRVFGITDTIYQITGVVGPPLGGLLVGAYGFKAMILTSGILYTLAAGLRIWMATTMKSPREQSTQELTAASFKSSVKTMFGMLVGGGVITWIFITDGIRDTAFRLSSELQPLYLEQIAGISVEQIGILGAIFSIAMMFTPMLSGKLVDRYEERVPITLGFAMVFAAFVYFLQASNFMGFAVTWVIFGTGVGLLSPAYNSLMTKVVPQKMLGIFMGLFRSSIGLISLPAPWIGAQLWERFSPRLPFTITAGAALITLIPIWLKFKVPEKTEELAFDSTD
ncbi:MAG: MFS transporter [Anaerolineales bacterium]|jgi:MFS family permease